MCIYTQHRPPTGPGCHWMAAVQRRKKNWNKQKNNENCFCQQLFIDWQGKEKKKSRMLHIAPHKPIFGLCTLWYMAVKPRPKYCGTLRSFWTDCYLFSLSHDGYSELFLGKKTKKQRTGTGTNGATSQSTQRTKIWELYKQLLKKKRRNFPCLIRRNGGAAVVLSQRWKYKNVYNTDVS